MNQKDIQHIGVIGAGSWGTTLANLLAEKTGHVDLWVREEDVYQQILDKRINEVFLPGAALSPNLHPVRSLEKAAKEKDLLLLVVPSNYLRGVLNELKTVVSPGTAIMTASKGIENNTLMTISQIVEDVMPPAYMDRFACLAGPSFAKEVAHKYPTAVTVACRDEMHAKALQQVFNSAFFRVYTSQDIIGTELGGALKNVIALGAGASDGLGFGSNARAALITRGLAEITRLAVAMGANPHTLAGLSGMGDLVLTCTGELSRNRTVGYKLGQGLSLEEITADMKMVAEGIKTTRSAYELGKKIGVELPIIDQVHALLYEGKDPHDAVRDLMSRQLKVELEH